MNRFDVGGLERCVARVCDGLDRSRFEPSVVVLRSGRAAERWIETDDVKVTELNLGEAREREVARALAGHLRRERIDIVHSHNWPTLVETVLARRMAGTRVHVHSQRGMNHHNREGSWPRMWLRKRLMRWACGRCDKVVAVADAVAEDLSGFWGVDGNCVETIVNGIEPPPRDESGEAATAIRRLVGAGEDDVVVGSVGRLVPVKDFPTLVAAIGRLPANVRLLLVGEGPERARLEAMASECGVADRVHLLGERSDVGDCLAAMDVYVNCSLNEGMSQSVLEAMSLGLPIVATNAGANAELVGAGAAASGRVVPRGDDVAMAGAIETLLSRPERVRFGEAAVRRYEARFTTPGMVAAYEELYERLMPQRETARPLAGAVA